MEQDKEKLILAYNKLKEDLDKEKHNETLRKFKILNKAYKLGEKIYGKKSYSIMKLSLDFDLPYTTCKRILSLRRATKETWRKINEGKISSFKATHVLNRKNRFFQDETINLVISQNLSTFQIKSLNIRNQKDIRSERLRVALEKGFARASTCYHSFYSTLERLEQLMLLEKKDLPKMKIPMLKKKLKEINKGIDNYLKEKLE